MLLNFVKANVNFWGTIAHSHCEADMYLMENIFLISNQY